MAGFKNLRTLIDLEADQGGTWFSSFRKLPNVTTSAGFWFDFSMSPGNPPAQYYAASPETAIAMSKSNNGGLNHGQLVSPKKKYLRKLMIMATVTTAVPTTLILCDYLLFYPFLDESSTDTVNMVNTVTLPRYTDGDGVMMMPVIVGAHAGTPIFNVSYTNSDGVAGRVSPNITFGTQSVNGTIVSAPSTAGAMGGPFIPLQGTDKGVRSLDSITFVTPDIGLITIALVKPIATITIRETTAPVEVDYLKDFMLLPEIKDDAYLNFIGLCPGTISGCNYNGYIETIWN